MPALRRCAVSREVALQVGEHRAGEVSREVVRVPVREAEAVAHIEDPRIGAVVGGRILLEKCAEFGGGDEVCHGPIMPTPP